MPTVRVLAVEHFECSVVDEGGDLHSDFTLDALYVLHSDLKAAFTWPSLEWFAKKYKVWKLTLWKYDLRYNGLTTSPWEKAIISHNPHTICPVVIVVPDEGPNPIAE
ncbi:hypothetical protein OPQ81_008543 [Rhizoctonia solani]|nr:hypothetical protein OPQ81_008543 [Rhizoctonia solani]